MIQCSCGSISSRRPVDFLGDVSVGTHDCNVDRVTVAKPMMGSQQILHEMCDMIYMICILMYIVSSKEKMQKQIEKLYITRATIYHVQ